MSPQRYFVRGAPYETSRIIYNEKHYDVGEVLEIAGDPYDQSFYRLGYVSGINENTKLVPCDVCGARFVSESTHAAHSEICHGPAIPLVPQHSRSGVSPDSPPAVRQAAPTPEPEVAPRSRVGHPQDAEWRSWTFEDLREMLKDGWRKARSKYPEKKRPSFDDVAGCVGHSRTSLTRALTKHGHTWETIRPFLVD